MTPNEKSIMTVIKAVESEIDKTPIGALRNFLCDLNIILHKKLTETEPKQFKCNFCDRKFINEKDLQRHQQTQINCINF